MATVLITGGTGMIGTALTAALVEKNYDVIILTRRIRDAGYGIREKVSYALWNVENQTIDIDAVSKADFIVHLAGANVGEKRWTKKRKQEIVDSRVKSSELLAKALDNNNKVKAVIGASGIGWYGEGEGFIEADSPADDFLGRTCKKWEESIEPVTKLGKRLVKLRTGAVLSNEAGYLAEFKKYMRFGLATILGNGKQIISWIHIADIVRIYIEAIENENLSGVYNAISPQPVSNKDFIMQLGKVQRGKFFIPIYIPAFMIKILFGEMSIEVLKSTNVSCEKLLQTGFRFQFPILREALKELK